jgi:hypothetical protein
MTNLRIAGKGETSSINPMRKMRVPSKEKDLHPRKKNAVKEEWPR